MIPSATAPFVLVTHSNTPSTKRPTSTPTRISSSIRMTLTSGTSTSVRFRTSTKNTCTGKSRAGTITSLTRTTTRTGRKSIFCRSWLHGKGEPFKGEAQTFQSGSNTWHTYDSWPPQGTTPTNLYLRQDGTLSFDPVKGKGGYREYVSDPANPVPYRQRPMSPTY